MRIIKALIRWSIYLVLLLALLGVAAVIALRTGAVTSRIAGFVEGLAEERGVQLKIEDLSFGAGTVAAKQIQAFFKKAFFSLTASNVTASLNFSSLMEQRFDVALAGDLYQGTLSSQGSGGFGGEDPRGRIELKDLHLNSHEQFAGFGITSGILNVTFDGKGGPSPEGKLEMTLRDLERPLETALPLKIGHSAEPVKIPKVSGGSGSISASLANGHLAFSNISFDSSLGKLRGKGASELVNGKLRPSMMHFDVALSPEGAQALGPQLPQMSGGALLPENTCFSCDLQGGSALWQPLAPEQCNF